MKESGQQVLRLAASQAIPAPVLAIVARVPWGKGMAGLVDEGAEVIEEGKEKEDAPADLALIGAAQRVEHYEMAA